MSRLNVENTEHVYRAWQLLEAVETKLGDFFVLAFVVSRASTGYLTLPKRFVCQTLNLKAERYRILFDALLNLQILVEDLRWDKKLGCCVHYRMQTLDESLLPELIGLDEQEFLELSKAIIFTPIPKVPFDDPYDIARNAWRAVQGSRVSINGSSNSRAPKTPRKSFWPMKYGHLIPNNPFTKEQDIEGTAFEAQGSNASIDKKQLGRAPRMTERAKCLYTNTYKKTVLLLKELELIESSNSLSINSSIAVSPLCSLPMVSTGDSGNVYEPIHETGVNPNHQSIISASPEATGGADGVQEAPMLDPIGTKGLEPVPKPELNHGFFAKPKPELLMETQFHGIDPMELGCRERVQYLWYTFNRIVKRFPALKQHHMPPQLAKGTYEFKESGNQTIDRMWEWAAKEEWFIHWTICLYRIAKNKFLHNGTKDWKLTIDWLFRPYLELNAETEEAIDYGLNIDEKVLGVGWGIESGGWYKHHNKVSLWDKGYVDVYEDGLNNWVLLAHRGLAEFDPWFEPSIDIMNAQEHWMELDEYLAAIANLKEGKGTL